MQALRSLRKRRHALAPMSTAPARACHQTCPAAVSTVLTWETPITIATYRVGATAPRRRLPTHTKVISWLHVASVASWCLKSEEAASAAAALRHLCRNWACLRCTVVPRLAGAAWLDCTPPVAKSTGPSAARPQSGVSSSSQSAAGLLGSWLGQWLAAPRDGPNMTTPFSGNTTVARNRTAASVFSRRVALPVARG
jgi:hypothetical protein